MGRRGVRGGGVIQRVCANFCSSFATSRMGEEQARAVQRNAAGRLSFGYCTSERTGAPASGFHYSIRL
jgi:hypothetical protein